MDEASKPDRALEEAVSSARRPLFWVWAAFVLMLLSAVVFPTRSNLIRGLILTFGLLTWAGLPVLVWRKRWLGIGLTAAPLDRSSYWRRPGGKRIPSAADANGINETDAGRLLPGDVAVTRDGIHTLI